MEYKSSKQNVAAQRYGNTHQDTAPHRRRVQLFKTRRSSESYSFF